MTKYIIVILVALSLAACGFQPLYAQYNKDNIPPVYISPMPEQSGQFLYSELSYLLSSTTQQLQSHYTLKITLDTSASLLSDDVYNDTAQWWQIETIARVILVDNNTTIDSPSTDNKKPIFRKNFFERGGIAVGHSPSAYFAGKTQAEQQILSQLARSIYEEITFHVLANKIITPS